MKESLRAVYGTVSCERERLLKLRPETTARLARLARICDNFLYGFKGGPPARQARAQPARMGRELETRSAGEECVIECEHDHLVLSGEWAGVGPRPWRRLSRAPLARER